MSQSVERKAFHKLSLPEMDSELPESNECGAPQQKNQN